MFLSSSLARLRSWSRDPGLGGWLHRTALLVSQNLLRSEVAHQRRTELAKEKSDLSSGQDIEIFFEGVDEALNRLSESDRTVVMMRFFEEKEFREIGAKVGKSPDAVQKQIRRALDKLNRSLTAKGATFSLATIGLVLSSELAKAAPVASSAMISAKAVTATSSIPVTSNLVANIFHTMNTIKTTTAVGAVLLVAAIPAAIQHSQAKGIRKELTELSARKQGLAMTRSTSSREVSTRRSQTPVRRLLASSKKSLTGEEFLAGMQEMTMSQDRNQVLRFFLPIALMNEDEIQTLLTEVELAGEQFYLKGFAMQMLMEMSPESEKDRGASLARLIENGESRGFLLPAMSEWVGEDLEGALAWFQAGQKNGSLSGKGIESVEPVLARALAAKLAKSDPKRAFALMDSVEPSGRAIVLAGMAGVLAEQGKEGWQQLVAPIKEIKDSDSVSYVVQNAVNIMAARGQRNEVLDFLESIDASPKVERQALAWVVASDQSGESVSERMNWLQDNIGDVSLSKNR